MPNVIDFSALQGDPFKGALDPVLAALDERNRQKQRDAQLAFQREQEQRRALSEADKTQHERALEAATQRKQQGIETLANNKGREQADQRIRQAAGAGDFAEAQRAANAYAEVDPTTGNVVQGRQFSVNRPVGPPPPAAGPPSPLEEGPQASPDEAQQAGLIRGAQQTPGDASPAAGAAADAQQTGAAEAERQRFQQASTPDAGSTPQQQGNQLVDPHTVAMARQASWKQDQENPSVTIGGATTSPDEIRHSQSRAAAQDFEAVGQALQAHYAQAMSTGDPVTIASAKRQLEAYERTAPGVATGAISPTAATAQVAGAASGEARFEQNSQLQSQRDEGAMQRAEVGAQAAESRDAAKAAAKKAENGGVDPKAAARFEGDLQHFQTNMNISQDRKDESRMATLLNNKDTSIVARAMAGNLARGIGAERGVLTDKDISRLQGNLGGAWGDVENWLSKADSGDLSPQVKQKLVEGVQVVLAEKAKARKDAEAAYMSNFGSPDSIYAGWGLADHAKRKFKEIFGHDMAGSKGAPGGGEAPPGGVIQHNPETGAERWKMPDGTYIDKK